MHLIPRWVTLISGRSKTEVHNRGPHAQNGRDQKVALGIHLQASENFKHENRLYFCCIATATQPHLGKCVGWVHFRSRWYFILIQDHGNFCMCIHSECSALFRLKCGCGCGRRHGHRDELVIFGDGNRDCGRCIVWIARMIGCLEEHED